MASNTVTIRILGDSRSAEAAMNRTATGLQGFENKMKATGARMRSVGKTMTMAFTLPVVAGLALSFKAASDMNESLSKVTVVFGKNAAEIKKWAKTAAESMGMSRQQALESAATFGNLFRAMDIGNEPATRMSKKLVQLAADLASFNNASPEDVLIALRAGLVGEVEPLRKFGVQLSAVRVGAEALSMGLVKATGDTVAIGAAQIGAEKAQMNYAKAVKAHGKESLEARSAAAALMTAEAKLAKAVEGKVPVLNAAQKAQAAFSIITKDTALAQGDFARTSDGAANQQRILTAKLKDTAGVLGKQLLPIGIKVMGFVSKLLTGFQGLSKGSQKLVIGVALLVAVLGPLLIVLGSVVSAVGVIVGTIGLIPLAIAAIVAAVVLLWIHWDTVWNFIMKHKAIALIIAMLFPFLAMFVLIVGGLKWVWQNWDHIWNTIRAITSAVWAVIGPTVMFGVAAVVAAVQTVTRIIGIWIAIFNTVKMVVVGGIDAVVGFFSGLVGRIAGAVSSVANAIAAPFKAAFNAIQHAWNSTVGGFNITIPKILGFGGGKIEIPSMHSGGIVPGRPGQDVLALLQAGERVISRGDVSRGDTFYLTVNNNGGSLSAGDVARAVRQVLKDRDRMPVSRR